MKVTIYGPGCARCQKTAEIVQHTLEARGLPVELEKVSDYFTRYEPSSPVPFLLKRARSLVTKNFMEVLRDLAPGGTEQANLIFGLRDGESD